jgi:hypothetical protein
MPTVLVLSFSDLSTDPRVARQIDWLADDYAVTAAGLAPPTRTRVRFVSVATLSHVSWTGRLRRGLRLITRRYERVYWDCYQSAFVALGAERPDLIVANDIDSLPLAIRVSESARSAVVFDAHEYAPREFDNSLKWRLLRGSYITYLCRRYVPQAQAVTTVGPGVAKAFAELIGVRPEIITNAPPYHPNLAPTSVAADRIRLVHHGVAIPARRIENMIDLAKLLDRRFEVSFILVGGDAAYRQRLQRLAAGHERIHFLPPVPMPELPAFLNQFDLGLFLLEPTNFNYLHALPNKLFEFLQARLGVAIGPSPDMADVVRTTGTGVIAADFRPATLAAELNRLTVEDVMRFKQAAHAAARVHSAEANREKFLAVCQSAIEARKSSGRG